MNDTQVIDILKKAIMLEQQGRNFYKKVADQTGSEAIRNIFTIMAEEEKKHEQILTEQASQYQNSGSFDFKGDIGDPEEFSREVLSKQITEQISAASYEAASISAAIAMEQKTVDLYSSQAEQSRDAAAKKMYSELAKWEKTHVGFLNEIYNDLLESSWYDSSFWPF
ncbi:MAG: ferritin-like domain-containing protein [Spirochaetota bacterium]